jgi:hypothetical protein
MTASERQLLQFSLRAVSSCRLSWQAGRSERPVGRFEAQLSDEIGVLDGFRLAPKVLKPRRRQLSIADSVLDRTVTEQVRKSGLIEEFHTRLGPRLDFRARQFTIARLGEPLSFGARGSNVLVQGK